MLCITLEDLRLSPGTSGPLFALRWWWLSEVKRLWPGEIFQETRLRQVLILVNTISLLTKFKLDAADEVDAHCALGVMGLVLQICPLGARLSRHFL